MAKTKIATMDAGTDAAAALSAALAELEQARGAAADLRRLLASPDPEARARAVIELPGAERDAALAELAVIRARKALDDERAKDRAVRQADAASRYDEALAELAGLYAGIIEALGEADRRYEVCQGLGVRREPPGRPPRTAEDYTRWRKIHGF